ncbi:hypothetical protein BOX15_Mlig009560g1, partial [Macrostomum lignano]
FCLSNQLLTKNVELCESARPKFLISGLSTEELNWVSSESATRYLRELSGEFARQLDAEEIQILSEDQDHRG